MLTEMTRANLDDLIATANRLSNNLDMIANNELSQFGDIAHQLDVWSWETMKMARDLKLVREMV